MQKKDNKIKKNFKLIIIFLAMMVLFFIPTKSNAAQTEQLDGVAATLSDSGILTISGSGELKRELVRKFDYKYKINKVVINSGITSIGNSTFSGCWNLTSIIIPEGVTSIGNDAFYNSALATITIPEGVTSIGNDAFSICWNLTSITIPGSVVENLEISGFETCDNLIKIEVDKNNSNYSSENGVLFNKDKTKIICYPGGKQENSYTIPNSVVGITARAFDTCWNLTSITIPEGVTSIGWMAFYGCRSLTSITIPSSVNNIKYDAFDKCINLKEIKVNNNNENYISENGVLFNKNKTELIRYPIGKKEISYIIPEGVTNIGEGAFLQCIHLTNINIPEGVTSIEINTFACCSSLTNIEIPSSVKSIAEYAFYECNSLKSIIIPNSVTSIGKYAFYKCESLTSIEIPNSVTSIGDNAFMYSEIYIYIQNENEEEIELPSLLKRAINEEDILFSDSIEYTNCTLDNSKNKISVNKDDLIKNGANIKIKQGKLSELTYYINYNKMDVSKNKDGSTYAIYNGGENITISGQGEVTKFISRIPYKIIKTIEIQEGVTSIGFGAFYGCRSLTSITIPSSVNNIEYNAFDECIDLKKIKVNNNNENYISENGVLFNKEKTQIIRYPEGKQESSYTIPSGVISIKEYAFEDCSNLTNIEIPSSVTSIEEYAFYGCSNLTNIDIPSSVTSIENSAFEGCGRLKSIEIPNSVTYIGSQAFMRCSSLKSIKIPNGVTELRIQIFQGCSSLTSITIPSSVTSIEQNAFADCHSLSSIALPSSVTSIRHETFEFCSNLTCVIIPEEVTYIDDKVFWGCNENLKIYCKSNSKAKEYAESNSINYTVDDDKPIIVGNVNDWIGTNFELVIKDEKCGLKEVTIDGEKIEIGKDGIARYTVSKNGRTNIIAKDYLGNTLEKTVGIDTTKPTLTVSKNTNSWAKEIVLTINAVDSESGLKNVKVNGKEITLNDNGQATYKVTQNGTYEIVATDNVGNTQTKRETVNKIIEKIGDINKDSKINISDVIAAIRHIGAKEGSNYYLNEEKRFIADINQDGKINIADVIGIIRLISKTT